MMLLVIQQIYAHVTFALSILMNSLLLSLLLFRKDRNLGSYKCLMFAFSFLGLFFSIVDFSNKPMVHVYGGAYLVFSLNSIGLPHFLAVWFNVLNCTCYVMTISLLAVHFIYRYLAVCRPNKMSWFLWPNTVVWFLFCAEISFEWWISAILLAGEKQEIDDLVKESMKINYNLTNGEFIYAGSLYYKTDSNGLKTISWPDLLFALNILKLISICMVIVLFCGISTFRKLRTLRYTSKRTTTLQNQLFKALVTQTIIPVVTMFIPAAVMMISPLFEITFGSYEGLIMTFITIYPCVDPMVVIFFVRDYRNAIWQTVRCKKLPFGKDQYSLRGTAVSFVTEAI